MWDLSDQDSDSMLSLREFCFALYLMERYREGRPLPSALPNDVMYNETLLSMTGPPKVPCGNAAWGPATGPGISLLLMFSLFLKPIDTFSYQLCYDWIGFGPQKGMPGARPIAPTTGPRPPRAPMQFPPANNVMKSGKQDLSAPALGDSFFSQTDGMDQADSNLQETTASEKKAFLIILIYVLFNLGGLVTFSSFFFSSWKDNTIISKKGICKNFR